MNENIGEFLVVEVSIIVPIYNVESYLPDLVSNIKGQTFSNFEVIFVVDGSPDDSLGKLKSLTKNDKRFMIINQDNKGSGESRNVGVRAASGKYLYFADPDDMLNANLLKDNLEIINQKQADIIVFGFDSIDSTSGIKLKSARFLDKKQSYFYREKNVNDLFEIMNWSLWNKIIKRDLVVSNSIESPKWPRSQDAGFMMEILEKNPKIIFNTKNISYYSYRIERKESATTKFFELAPKYQSIISNTSRKFANNYESNLFLYRAYLGNIMRYSVLAQLNRKNAPQGFLNKIKYIQKSRKLIETKVLLRIIFDTKHELRWTQRLFGLVVFFHLEYVLLLFKDNLS